MKLFKFSSLSFYLFLFLFGFVFVNVVNAVDYTQNGPGPIVTGTVKISGPHTGTTADPFQIGDTIKVSGTAYCKGGGCYQSVIHATIRRADLRWEKENPWVNFQKDLYPEVNIITMKMTNGFKFGDYHFYSNYSSSNYYNLHGETSFTVPSIPANYIMYVSSSNNGSAIAISIPFSVTGTASTLTASPSPCIIKKDESSCTTDLTITSINVDPTYGVNASITGLKNEVIVPDFGYFQAPVTKTGIVVNHPDSIFYLNGTINNSPGLALISKPTLGLTVKANCIDGTTWDADISKCKAPSGSISATNCTIALNASTCPSSVSWSSSDIIPGSSFKVTHNNPDNTSVSSSKSGTQSVSITNGFTDFYIYNNSIELASATATASCVDGSAWDSSSKTCKTSIPTPITVSISANPAGPLTATGSTSLTWTTTNSPSSCTASNSWSGAKTSSGGTESRTGMAIGTYHFDITCSKAGLSDAVDSVAVVVNAAGKWSTLTCSSTPGTAATTLTSTCSVAGTCTGSAPTKNCPAVVKCTEPKDTNYNVGVCSNICKNGGTPYPSCPTPATTDPIASISATSPIAYGAKSTLSWSSTNATSCTTSTNWSNVRSPLGPSSGWTDALTSNATFTYTCTGNGKTVSDSATVVVGTAPVVKCTEPKDTNYGVDVCSNICKNGGTPYPSCPTPVVTDGSWSNWSSRSEVCPYSGTQYRTCTAPSNGGKACSQIDGGNSSQAYTNDQCPRVDINGVSSGGRTISGTDAPYNSFVKIDWSGENTGACTCTYKDSTITTPKVCVDWSGTTPYSPPALKRDTTFTISCMGIYGASVTKDIEVPVAPINPNYKEN